MFKQLLFFFFVMFSIFSCNVNREVLLELQTAQALYEQGNYTPSAEIYKKLVTQNTLINGKLLYNYGNILYRQGLFDKALAVYLLAQTYSPRDPELAGNIEHIKRKQRDSFTEEPTFLNKLLGWSKAYSLFEFLWVNSILIAFSLFMLIINCFYKIPTFSYRFTFVLVVFIAVLSTILTYTKYKNFSEYKVAVVSSDSVDVYSVPESQGVIIFKLKNLTDSLVVGQRSGWIQIELPDGKKGWAQEQNFVVLSKDFLKVL